MTELRRYKGSLLGLATGDAVGTTLEFKAPGSFAPITDMVGAGPFNLKPGEWTDDTSMALCLADSLIACKGFDAKDQMDRYLRWSKEGYLSSNGECFDIGGTVGAALQTYERSDEPFAGPTAASTAGNGSLMRLAPIPLAFRADPAKAFTMAVDSSRTTHGTLAALDACRYMTALIIGALNGASKDELLGDHYSPVAGYWESAPLSSEIDEIALGSFKRLEPPAIQGSGYVVKSLEAALYAFYKSKTFEEGCLIAANLGDDADTTAAIYGQLAGAFYGEDRIPKRWLEKLAHRELIEKFATQLFELSPQLVTEPRSGEVISRS